MTKATVKDIAPEIELLVASMRRYPLDWIVVYCNPQCERRAYRGMMEKGVFAYLPEQIVERRQPRSKKKFTVRKSLFTRYLFAGVDPSRGQSLDQVRACDGVEGIVSFDQNKAPVRVDLDDLCSVIKRLNVGESIKDGTWIKVGETLHLVAGVFAGFEMAVTAYQEGADVVRGEVSLLSGKTPVIAPVDHVKRSA